MQTRDKALHEWLKNIYPTESFTLTPLLGDASFRRYYRLQQEALSQIVMDAPPLQTAMTPFVAISSLLSAQGIITPKIHAVDPASGFALLEDFGNTLFKDALSHYSAPALYQEAIGVLCQMQQYPAHTSELQVFDQTFMLQELALFQEWFLERYLGLHLSNSEQALLTATFHTLTAHLLLQPQVFIHRDYHSRNIMLLEHGQSRAKPQLGIIDFQDAMRGPLAYDLVSLLKDCYIRLSQAEILEGLTYFFEHSPYTQAYTFPAFQQAFDWCGLQRHLKILGIFCRLHLRDGKPNYLQDLPLTFDYVLSCLEHYREWDAFRQWLQERVQQVFWRSCR